MITPRHAHIPQNKLREKRQIKTEKYQQGRNAPPNIGVHFARNFGPPEVHAAQISHHLTTDHNIMEVRHHKIRVVQVNIQAHTRQK